MTIDEIANLKIQRRLKVLISILLVKSNRFEIDQVYISINQRSRSSQTQNLKQNSNTSNSIFLQSITLFSTLRVNQLIKNINACALNNSITSLSRIDFLRALIRVTITQLTFLLNSFRQNISLLLLIFILT